MSNKTIFPILFLCCLTCLRVTGQNSYRINMLAKPPVSSIRGMSVVNDSVVWVSGTNGKMGRTTDGGEHWEWHIVPGHDSCDWRSIVAFNSQRALLLNAGAPAYIMLTTDGGATWKEVYHDTREGIFFDGMAFFPSGKSGFAVGDPIDGHFVIIRTSNGGRSWHALKKQQTPAAQKGEAIFAASGTSVRVLPGGTAAFVTGGTASRFFTGWKVWSGRSLPLNHGSAGAGAFSVAFRNGGRGLVIGGDYTKDTLSVANCCHTLNGGLDWAPSAGFPGGYRSCVQYINDNVVITTGTSGTDLSTDGGQHWQSVSTTGFHVIGVSAHKVFLAGSGKLAVMELK
jgi:photosystem II stability/assembly factor-like uncharacterized protein